MIAPRDTEGVALLMTRAERRGRRLRPVGSGHSFTPLVASNDVLVSLHRLSEVRDVQWLPGGEALVTVGAGMSLRQLNLELAARGLALANLGDIDAQSVAGAIGTGTHGTGARLRGLSAQVAGFELVDGRSKVWWASDEEHPKLFRAGRLSLGALGILTAVQLHAVPMYILHARDERARLTPTLAQLDSLLADHDHVEFFWFPHTDLVQLKRSDVVPGPPHPLAPARRWWEEQVMENYVFGAANRLGSLLPPLIPAINRASGALISQRDYSDESFKVYCTRRGVRFAETEWAVPRETLGAVLYEIAQWLRRSGERISFPIEVRFAAYDDVWLSTAYGRDVAYIAAHTYWRREHERFFAAVARIAAQVDGRPHWGKLHPYGLEDLRPLYPHLDEFRAVRDRHDPYRRLASPYLTQLLGR